MLDRFLMTGKPTSNMAFAYSNYIVSSVNAREIFKYISLEISQHWDILLWMDSSNFGGVTCSNPLFEDGPGTTEAERLDVFAVDMNWNIASFLPPALRTAFNDAIFLFIQGIRSAKQQSLETHRSPLRVLQNTLQSQPDPTKSAQSDLVKAFVQQKLTRSLLKMLQELQRQHAVDAPDEDQRPNWEFPNLPGRYLKMTNPILEGIKFICAVLSLAKEQSAEVGVLRRNLLDLINVRE
jgi:DNA polymerase epsilon subunit 1